MTKNLPKIVVKKVDLDPIYLYNIHILSNKGKGKNMQISNEMGRAFNKAITNPENFNKDGSVNWNFIDADCYMDVKPDDSPLFNTREEGQSYIDQFDYLADVWEGKYTVHQVRQNRIQIMPVTNPDLILDPSKPAYIVKTL